MPSRVSNKHLLEAGLTLLEESGKEFTKLPNKGRAMLYKFSNGETVRVRTCNDHILIAVADSTEENANLNIEGTDWLLIVMPEIPRTPGNVIAYLIPTNVAIKEVREAHKRWLSTNPKTRGQNTTWNLWFSNDGPKKANGYADKWSEYRLEYNSVSITEDSDSIINPIKAEIVAARLRISNLAGVSPEAVHISIVF
ncbi:MAG: hypothetical protein OXF95_03775 [Rhodobacteraceae bacterium]|nr:hypothetical protein [Paracoccaceae bacterium]